MINKFFRITEKCLITKMKAKPEPGAEVEYNMALCLIGTFLQHGSWRGKFEETLCILRLWQMTAKICIIEHQEAPNAPNISKLLGGCTFVCVFVCVAGSLGIC